MLIKTNKLKITLSATKIILLFAFAAGVFLSIQVILAGRFSAQENALYENLMQDLVTQDICTDRLTCASKINFYRKSGNRIYFNLYNQADMAQVAAVSKFLVKDGIRLSHGKPITLKAYATAKTGYLNYAHYFGHEEPLVSLEIEK